MSIVESSFFIGDGFVKLYCSSELRDSFERDLGALLISCNLCYIFITLVFMLTFSPMTVADVYSKTDGLLELLTLS